KLTCGTPNANRARGGVSYYCVPSSSQNYLCWKVDAQIPEHLQAIQVDPDLIPQIRKVYLLGCVHAFTSNWPVSMQTNASVSLPPLISSARKGVKSLTIWMRHLQLFPKLQIVIQNTHHNDNVIY